MNKNLVAKIIMLSIVFLFLSNSAHAGMFDKRRSRDWYLKYGLTSVQVYDPAYVSKIIPALDDRNSYIKKLAFKAICEHSKVSEEARSALADKALTQEKANDRISALRCISRSKDPRLIPVYMGALRDEHVNIRKFAVTKLNALNYTGKDYEDVLRILVRTEDHRKFKPFLEKTLMKVSIARASQSDAVNNIPVETAPATTSWSEPKVIPVPVSRDIPRSAPRVINQSELHDIPNFFSIPRKDDLAIVIGIEKYSNVSQPSKYSENDALIMKEYLLALGFQPRNMEVLINEKASLSGLKKSFEAWLPNHVKSNSRVFIYYSGHGAPDTKGNGYIVPYDGDPNYLEVTAYPIEKLYGILNKLDAAEIIVALDSCFSGQGDRSLIASGIRPMGLRVKAPTVTSNKIAIISSSGDNQVSTIFDEKGHGLFTYYFIKALKEGKLTIADIYKDIKPKIENQAKRMNVEQSPVFINEAEDKVFNLR